MKLANEKRFSLISIHPPNRELNVKFAAQFESIADRKACKVSQLDLAWLLKQGGGAVIHIPGTKKLEYLG